ncbi:MAG: PEGA domain-containing protein [Methanoregula sp.]|nr:PEGA domain-containing protein [Methanoregula sp.]
MGAHVFGNFDWHESAAEEYWYYYVGSGGERYPTTTGLSMKYISELRIYSSKPSAPSLSYQAASSASNLPVVGSEPPADTALYGYKGKSMSTSNSGSLNGSIQLFSDPIAKPVVASNRIREFNVSVDLPPGSNITLARMYLYLSDSHYIQGSKGIIPSFSTRLNTTFLEPDKIYIDSDGDDDGQVAATVAYDIRELLKGNGTYTFSLRNMDQDQSVFTIDKVLLVTGYENETAPATNYWISEGCDVISSDPEKGRFPDDCKTDSPFAGIINISTVRNAELYLFSTGLDHNNKTEHTVKFNKGIWPNIFDNASAPDFIHLPVTEYLNETGNAATIESSIRSQDADYMINRNAILIIEHTDANSSASNTTTSEYVPHALPTGVPDDSPGMNESPCCRITLDSDPEGALVSVDGRYTGKTTPYTMDVPKGENHTVRFELDRYVPSEIQFTATNSTSIRPSLYAPVHTTKGRLTEEPEDPDGTRYGGLYIHSRPHNAPISINGISTGKVTPAMFMGLEPGRYTITLGKLQDIAISENDRFVFEEQTVWVFPEVITPVDVNGIGHQTISDIIIDSRWFRGKPFTVNGYVNNKTVPAKIRVPLFDSFITIHENESFVSYRIPTPTVWDEDRYMLFESRDHQDQSITVTSFPRGAEVFIDGFRTGYATPYTFGNISDGPHRITVTKAGYLPQQSLLDLPRQKLPLSTTTVDCYLEEYPSGFLYVNSIPEGGKVSIDSVFTGEVTPALFKFLPTGTHLVEVKGTNTTKTYYDVTINSLSMVELSENFNESWER